ncbi:hypothetical protein D8T45_17140 [Vibrio vulnificus]|nr:hypothetical protein D8T45_17140 [Vibrio vulnificus]RZR08896.1 hypothetical protein D8T24_20735 [Vibrio vulnificus]
MRIHRHGRQRKASARSGEAKASEKINLKKCLTLQINSLECTSALREKTSRKAKLFNNINLSICVGTR